MEKVEEPNSSSTASQVQNSLDFGINNVEAIRKWELPVIDKNTIYARKGWKNLILDDHIRRKELTILINATEVEIDLLLERDIYTKTGHGYYVGKKGYFHYGLVQVAVKFLRKRRTNASACCLLRDARFRNFEESTLGLASGSLSQGILYFICKLDHRVSLHEENVLQSLQLKIATQGIEMEDGPIPLSLTYAVYYRHNDSNLKRNHTGDLGFTAVVKTDIHDDAYVPPTLSWNEIQVPPTWNPRKAKKPVQPRARFVKTNDGKVTVGIKKDRATPENEETQG